MVTKTAVETVTPIGVSFGKAKVTVSTGEDGKATKVSVDQTIYAWSAATRFGKDTRVINGGKMESLYWQSFYVYHLQFGVIAAQGKEDEFKKALKVGLELTELIGRNRPSAGPQLMVQT